jgi:predicted ATPase/class 3 adenylate cyclase
LLFSDIEGSTRLWEEHREAMAAALARHDEIMDRSVTDAGGTVLKTTGDGIIATFPQPLDGVRAAVSLQQSLQGEQWGPTGPIKVRVGLHAGHTERRDGDLFGPVMNRAARIMAAGHGGQILASSAVADLVRDDLPNGLAMRDLGLHRLKDLTSPEHLFQLVAPDLPAEFPALRTLDGRPNNLPQQTTEFVGRASEMAAVELMLESPATRLLTITGPGGAGKTRLALQVAAEQLDRFPDGVFFVDLAAETTPEGAYEAIARALSLTATGSAEPLTVLATRLRDSRMLLVLDNMEQVTTAGAGLVEILQRSHHLKILVTSRETLKVRAEHVYPVPALGLAHPASSVADIAEAESVRLFVDRARAVRPDFALSDSNAGTIAEIALRLDGLPLAIELAAARLNVFTPADLMERLRTRLDVLGSGGRDLPDRQRTLWGAIGWSYELLNDAERAAFEAMSVFTTANLDALESVIGMPDTIDIVGSLVDKSLLRSDDRGPTQRFSMLLMIKEYAASRLAGSPDGGGSVRAAHADYFASRAEILARALLGPERDRAMVDIDLELENLSTAWRHRVEQADTEQIVDLADAYWTIYEARGRYRAAIDVASDAIELLGDSHPEAALTLRTARARATMAVRGYTEDVEAEFRDLLEMSEGSATPTELFPVHRALATYYMNTANFEEAAGYGRRMIELGEANDDPAILLEGHFVYGSVTAFSGMLEEGMPHLDRCIELHDPSQPHSNRFRLGPSTGVTARIASGLILWQYGKLDEAVRRVEEGLTVSEAMGHPYSVAFALHHNGYLAFVRSRFEECIQFARRLREVADENDYVVWQTLATVFEGAATSHLGDVESGLEMTEIGVHLYQGTIAPPVFWPHLLAVRALVHGLAGQVDRALELSAEAVTLGSPEVTVSPELRLIHAGVLRMAGSLDEAARAYQEVSDVAATMGLRLSQLQALTGLVGVRRELSIEPDGSEDLRRVLGTFDQGLDEHDLVRAREVLAAT